MTSANIGSHEDSPLDPLPDSQSDSPPTPEADSSIVLRPTETSTTLTHNEKISMAFTGGSALAFLAIAALTTSWGLLLFHAIAVGALGGLVHEFAQSGGKIFFFRKEKDGLYLGSMTGMVLGIVAGLLVARSDIQPPSDTGVMPNQNQISNTTQTKSIDMNLSLEIFFAALALKGVTEAATGSPPSDDKK